MTVLVRQLDIAGTQIHELKDRPEEFLKNIAQEDNKVGNMKEKKTKDMEN